MAWAPDYVDEDELRDYVRVEDLDDDAQLALAITAGARAIDHHCNRQFGLLDAPAERVYTGAYPDGRGNVAVSIDDLMTTVGLVVTVDGTTVTTYTLEPRNAAAEGKPWTRLVFSADSEAYPTCAADEVSAVARWGWTETPDPVRQANLLQSSRFATRREAPFGVAGSPDMGSEMRLLAKLDPDVAVSLRGYRRPRGTG